MFAWAVHLRPDTKEQTGIDFWQGQAEIFLVKLFCITVKHTVVFLETFGNIATYSKARLKMETIERICSKNSNVTLP